MKHIRQLDSIRAIAVFLVIVSHWIPKLNVLPWGGIGVDIFFVLSGFLITGILLENKKLKTSHGIKNLSIIKNFIIRRTLRIFPIYYLMVIVHYFVAPSTNTTVDQNVAYYLSYTSNILFYNTNSLDGIASHFWSLAVEEQFYLIWPWVILLVDDKHLTKTFFIFLFVGVIFPMVMPGASAQLTPACFSSFALGAWLAYHRVKSPTILEDRMNNWVNYLAYISVLLLCMYPLLKDTLFEIVSIRLFVSLVALWIIKYCVFYNDQPIVNAVLNNKILVFVGKISYGIYIYHTIVPWAWRVGVKKINEMGTDIHNFYIFVPESLYNDIDLIVKLALLIGLSWLSWILVESPINRLKDRFVLVK